jgi:hypothetical protein
MAQQPSSDQQNQSDSSRQETNNQPQNQIKPIGELRPDFDQDLDGDFTLRSIHPGDFSVRINTRNQNPDRKE